MDEVCYHCAEPLPKGEDYQIIILDKPRQMCCPGCLAVAQTILDSGLASYYQYRTDTAAKAQAIPKELEDLLYYDDLAVQDEFVRHVDDYKEISLSLEGVTCAACAWLIEKQLQKQTGILKVQVNLTTSRALIQWAPKQIVLSKILTHIHQLGYTAAPFEASQQEASYHKQMQQLLYRLGVAGLASMQVMMLAVGLYFEVFSDLDDEFKQFLRIISLIFATPVLLYSAQPFYKNAWHTLRAGTLGMDVPVSIALIFAYVASIYATLTGVGDVYFESISMFCFFLLLGRFLEMRARRKAASASSNLLKLIPKVATKINGEQIAVKSLQLGDQIKVLAGDTIPADGVIITGKTYVDESMLTGESIPVLREINQSVYAGTINSGDTISVQVCAQKQNFMIENIVRLQDKAQQAKPKVAQLADQLAKYFVALLLIIAGCTWAYWHAYLPERAFWIMLSVLVATCPCALSLATPTAITCATSSLSKLGILMRQGHAFDALCHVNQVILDKTGTLTTGKISITEIESINSDYTQADYLAIAAAIESNANHPIAQAFKGIDYSSIDLDFIENHIGEGLSARYQGRLWKIGKLSYSAPDISLNHENTPHEHLHCTIPDTDKNKNTAIQAAQSYIFLSCDHQLMARFTYQDPIRPQSQAFIQALHQSGLSVSILSGDQLESTQAVAQQLGIQRFHANASPQDKLDILQAHYQDKICLMIGDGINDAPTLAAAHLSIAMGEGTDIAKASADMVLLGDKLERVLFARELAKQTQKIIRQNLLWALGYNAIILPLAVMGYIAPYFAVVGMSLSSLIVVSNSLRLLTPDHQNRHLSDLVTHSLPKQKEDIYG